MSERIVTIYTVKRSTATAGAQRAVGTSPVTFEFVAESESEAVKAAVKACQWERPYDNFYWTVTGSRILVLANSDEPIPTETKEPQ